MEVLDSSFTDGYLSMNKLLATTPSIPSLSSTPQPEKIVPRGSHE